MLYFVPLAMILVTLTIRAVVTHNWYGIAQAVAWTFLAAIPWTVLLAATYASGEAHLH